MDDLLQKVKSIENPETLLVHYESYQEMLMRYRCAIMEVETKIRVLNEEFSLANQRNPIESIKSRIKSDASILEKMHRRGFEISVENIEQELNDVAGVRVVCSFPQDIYAVAKLLGEQDDLQVIQVKDYIANPKPNGYRSLHLIIGVPIFLANDKKIMKVEVQLRTIAMDFWASLEHKVKYKKNVQNPNLIAAELRECADGISALDYRMQNIANSVNDECSF